jgi:mercuric ion binding protein
MLKRSETAKFGLLLGALAFSGVAFSSPRTVTLSVPGMNCEACPITVKKALQRVEGVEKVAVSFEPREAVVTFDDARTTVGKLTEATAKAGYPSAPRKSK